MTSSGMRITFRAKAVDGRVKVPKLTCSHVDMNAARQHPKYGSYANSDLFPAILARIAGAFAPRGYIDVSNPPDGVTVDASGFLAAVTFDVRS